jgi:hypothetical protein
MKKGIVFLIAIVIISFGCKTGKQTEYTVLGEYTPNFNWLIEKLNGNVEKLIEKFYWGVADGDNVRKGSLITSKEADSLGWGHIYELNFDTDGNLSSLRNYNDNNEYIGGWQFFKRYNRLDSAQSIWRDTVKTYDKLKYNKQGLLTEGSEYDANTDTLIFSWIKTVSKNGDTVEYKIYNKKGALPWKWLHLFDEKGAFIGGEYYGPDGTPIGSHRIKCNDKGLASEITFFDENGKPNNVMKRTYEYDSRGNWIKMTARNDKGEMNVHERIITYFR